MQNARLGLGPGVVLKKLDVLIFIKKEIGAQGWFEFVIFIREKGP
jgi:hypothetical protein|tara:strand:+ start:45 stop:179 length:135 start_codon:yes stop_codon:yes gene_type:complete